MSRATPRGYRPPIWFRGRHLQTVLPSLWPAPALSEGACSLEVDVGGGNAVRVDTTRPEGRTRGTLLLLHGLGGDSEAPYMRRTARAAAARGWAVGRMNLRNCGGTEKLSRTLYNAGQSGDAEAALERLAREGFPEPFAACGFSLGGNIVLRYAGMAGVASRAAAVAGVNAPIDLALCLDALEAPVNRMYQFHFVVCLCRQVERARRIRPVAGPPARPWAVRTLRRFDDLFTAPDAGYPSAAAYYEGASAIRVLDGIRVPTLVVSADNDPFVPRETFEAARRVAPGGVEFVHPAEGGHVGYWQSGPERFWAAEAVLDFLDRVLD